MGIKLSKALILCAGSKMEESACMFAFKAKIVHYDINIVKLPFLFFCIFKKIENIFIFLQYIQLCIHFLACIPNSLANSYILYNFWANSGAKCLAKYLAKYLAKCLAKYLAKVFC